MRTITFSFSFLVISLCTILVFSCKREDVPVLTTSLVSEITASSAISGGIIIDEGSDPVISKGVCWSTSDSPTVEDNKTIDGSGPATFSSNMTNLNPATDYNVRAYASNRVGTGYGPTQSFKTLGQSPVTTIGSAADINVSTATLTGYVNANYLSTEVLFEYGTSLSYGNTITALQ